MSDKNWSPFTTLYNVFNPDQKRRKEKKREYNPSSFMIKLNYIKLHNNIQYTFFIFYLGYNRVTS
jgi:hypothetical protein